MDAARDGGEGGEGRNSEEKGLKLRTVASRIAVHVCAFCMLDIVIYDVSLGTLFSSSPQGIKQL